MLSSELLQYWAEEWLRREQLEVLDGRANRQDMGRIEFALLEVEKGAVCKRNTQRQGMHGELLYNTRPFPFMVAWK